jgi:hypothetical protein
VVDGLKVLDPERPIREADKRGRGWNVRFVPKAVVVPTNNAYPVLAECKFLSGQMSVTGIA